MWTDHVEAAGPGQQRFQPRRADLGRVAGDDQSRGVAVADLQVAGGVLDGGGAYNGGEPGRIGRARGVDVRSVVLLDSRFIMVCRSR